MWPNIVNKISRHHIDGILATTRGKINQTFQEIESENLCQQKYEERLKEEDFGDSKYGIVRKYLWNLTEYPETSIAAQVAHIIIS